jgi:hypothetical protein
VLGGGTRTGNAADDLLASVKRMTQGRKMKYRRPCATGEVQQGRLLQARSGKWGGRLPADHAEIIFSVNRLPSPGDVRSRGAGAA